MWEATTNSGVALETVAKEIAAYQTSGTFEADYSHFCTLLQSTLRSSLRLYATSRGQSLRGRDTKSRSRSRRARTRKRSRDVRELPFEIPT